MAVQGISGGSSLETSSSKPARRRIQDEIIAGAKKTETAPVEQETTPANDAVKTTPKDKRMSIQNELLTYGAGGKKAASTAETETTEKPTAGTGGTEKPKTHVTIQNQILGYGKDKQPVTGEGGTKPATETSA